MKKRRPKKISKKINSNFIAVGIASFLIAIVFLTYSFITPDSALEKRERPAPTAVTAAQDPYSICYSKNDQYCENNNDCKISCCLTLCSEDNKCVGRYPLSTGSEDLENGCLKKDGKVCDGKTNCVHCIDSDEGTDDIFISSTTIIYKSSGDPELGVDTCTDENSLEEFICTNDALSSRSVVCSDYNKKCRFGACVI